MLSGLPGWLLALALLAGVALDAWWGEPRRWHPLVGFGRLTQALEARMNRGRAGVRRGALGWALLVLPPVAVLALGLATLQDNGGLALALAVAVHALTLYAALGLRSLGEHTLSIAQALDAGQLTLARQRTRWIVSRDTEQSSPDELAKAAVESLLENGNDAVFATLFWFAVAGGPGALLFRLANTLDAMWGYRSVRFNRFGRCAARLDDALNYLPARLTAGSYALLGHTRLAWRCWRTQAPAWPSPNAGPVMAAGAGALGVQLGGLARYDGVDECRPPLGDGPAAQPADIARAWRLVWRSCALWLLVLGGLALGVEWACR